MITPTDKEISAGRIRLAISLELDPAHLEFKGVQELAPGMPELMLFNVRCEGHPRDKSTLSVRVGL